MAGGLREQADEAPAKRVSPALLWGSAALSAVLVLLPLYLLVWVWPGVRLGATCDLVSQAGWCRPGYGVGHWLAVAALCLASFVLHVATAIRWPRPGTGRRSVLGLLAAATAAALVTVIPALLKGVVPLGWFIV